MPSAFVPLPGSPFDGPPGPRELAVSDDGQWLVVAGSVEGAARVRLYAVAPDGGLTETSVQNLASGPACLSIAMRGATLLIAVGLDGAPVAFFTAGPDGKLHSQTTPGGGPWVAFRKDGSVLAIISPGRLSGDQSTLECLPIDASGHPGTPPFYGQIKLANTARRPTFIDLGVALVIPHYAAAGFVQCVAVSPEGDIQRIPGREAQSVPASPFAVSAIGSGPSNARIAVVHQDVGVSVYQVDESLALSAVGPPVPLTASPTSARFTPDGRFLAASAANGTAAAFTVEDSGVLQPMLGSPYAISGGGPYTSAQLSARGQHLVLFAVAGASEGGAGVDVLRRSLPTARITAPPDGVTVAVGQPVPTHFSGTEGPGGPGLASVTDSNGATAPSGALDTSTPGPHSYVVTATSLDGEQSIASIGYTVQSQPVAPVVGSPFPSRGNWSGLAISADEKQLALVDSARTLRVFPIGLDGSLGAPTDQVIDGGPTAVAFSATPGYVAVGAVAPSISMYTVDASGSLAPVAGSPFSPLPDPSTFDLKDIAFFPQSGGPLFASGGDFTHGALITYLLQNGIPTYHSEQSLGNSLSGISTSPSGSPALVAVCDTGLTTVSVFETFSSGIVALIGSLHIDGAIAAVACTDSFYLPVANASPNQLQMIVADTASSTVQLVGQPYPLGGQPTSLAYGGRRVAVATDQNGGTVSIYNQESGGVLTHVSDHATLGAPSAIAFSHDGRLLAVSGPNNISMFWLAPRPPSDNPEEQARA